MKRALLLILALTLLIPVGMTHAQEPGTKEDNACYEGGSMAGKCDTEWEWVCGYYLARWERAGGWNTPNNVLNTACISLLPPQPVETIEIQVLCRVVPATIITDCIYSDSTATEDTNSDGTVNAVALHTTGPIASCPATFAGRVLLALAPLSATSLATTFTPAELAAFGFTTNICIYN